MTPFVIYKAQLIKEVHLPSEVAYDLINIGEHHKKSNGLLLVIGIPNKLFIHKGCCLLQRLAQRVGIHGCKILVVLPGIVDRKSTRLNSSHVRISYAVFCLKKKRKHKIV